MPTPKPPTAPRAVYDVTQAAEALEVSPTYVRRLIDEGALPLAYESVLSSGRRFRWVYRDDVQELAERRRPKLVSF
jgi:excisionase family DNA binding protein